MNQSQTLLDNLSNVAVVFKDLHESVKIGKREIHSLVHILSHVKDFRCEGKTVYKLENLLSICFIMAMRGELQSFYYISEYLKIFEDEFVELGLIEKGKIPSHDTFRRVFGHLDANNLRDAFLDRIKTFLETLARLNNSSKGKKRLLSGDGKTFNGSGRAGNRNLNVFNIYSPSDGICLSSVPLTSKESEIPEFQRMLVKYDLKNTVVTADALHCQRKTSEIIIHRKGGYVFKVKNNQSGLLEEIETRFKDSESNKTTFSHNNCDYEFISLSKKYIGCKWPGQKTYVRMISHKRKGQKDFKPTEHFFISSESDPQLIAEAIDNRWDIEDGLHRFKDQFLGEDECSFMDENAVKVMATINNVVYSIYRIACETLGHKSMTETKIRFKDHPLDLISTIVPLLEKKNLNALVREKMRGRPRPQS